jgi:hypothetical protein
MVKVFEEVTNDDFYRFIETVKEYGITQIKKLLFFVIKIHIKNSFLIGSNQPYLV